MASRSSPASLREIAKATNLSITTVSRVLRRQGELSDETRARVLEVAKGLRYRPNMLVQGIQTGKTFTMGVVVPPFDNFWTSVLYGIHDELTAANYVYINVWCPHENGETSYSTLLLKQLHRLIDRRVDGIILWAHLAPLYDGRVAEELRARDLPVVTIDHELPFADSVETDEQQGAALVAEHLLKLGHRHFAHLAWSSLYKWAQLRRLFFEQRVAQEKDATCVTMSTENVNEVDSLTCKLLATKPRPTAIFACSDRIARLVYDAVGRLGLRIPEDVSIVGYADLDMAKWMHPGLTTIRQHGEEMGAAAARLLVERSQGKIADAEPRRIRIKCELVERGSTSAPPAESDLRRQ